MSEEMDLLQSGLVVINVGIQDFGAALEAQGVQVIYVDWSPPAGGDQEMIDILDNLL
jgi:hypothetical protein